jgi:ribonucleoside-diphosphate reductase alpha chain
MQVEKRSGELVSIDNAKIRNYITHLVSISPELNHVNVAKLTEHVENSFALQLQTSAIPGLIAECSAALTTEHHHYSKLAGRACVECLHKETPKTFSESIGINEGLFNQEFVECVRVLDGFIDNMIVSQRDYQYDIFAIKTLERSYLLKHNNKIVETPQYMIMRVAVAVAIGQRLAGQHEGRFSEIIRETYDSMSNGFYTHATPTLFHAGLKKQQLASCYLMTMKDDSISGIYETLHNCALISKGAGGIGLSISQIRPSGSGIAGTNGTSNGLCPMLKVFNDTARYVDQCVVPETIIYTTRGPREIQNLVNGESIIHENDQEPITNVLEHAYNGPLLHMKTLQSVDTLKITPEHPLFVLKDLGKAYNYTETKKRIENGLNTPDWVDAKNVQPRDFIGFPIPNYQKDQQDISPDDCYFYGLLLGGASGSLMQNKSYGTFTIHTVEKAYIKEWLVQYFHSKCVQYSVQTEGNTTKIRWNKSTVLPIKYGDVYDGNKEKHVHHKWLHLPVQKCKYILKGLIDTDGSKGKELQFDSTSRNLIESVRYICLRMGILTSGYVRDRRGQSHTTSAPQTSANKKISYVLRIPKVQQMCDLVKITPGKFTKYFEHDNMLYTRVQSIDNHHYEGVLYDLQMSKDHSYITHSGLIHNGGGKRKGSFAIWLEPWHPDVETWLDLKKNHGDENARARDLFYGLWVPDLFMKRVKANESWSMFCPNKCPGLQDTWGEEFEALYRKYEFEGKAHKTINAQELWLKICDSQIETGTPYLMYKDACNRKSNQQNLGTIRSSNLCVAPETKILTSNGYQKICELQNVDVWNGHEFTPTTVQKTGENQELVTINFSNGSTLDCTLYHKFYIQTAKKNVSCIRAHELEPGMKIIKCEYPVIDNDKTMKYPYTHGLFCADGDQHGKPSSHECKYHSLPDSAFCGRHYSLHKDEYDAPDGICRAFTGSKTPQIALYGDKKTLVSRPRTMSGKPDKQDRLIPMDISEKYYVPSDLSLDTKLKWFAGFLDGDGCVLNNSGCYTLQVTSVHHSFLQEVLLMLQTMGVHSTISLSQPERTTKMPDGHGCKPIYRMVIASVGYVKLLELGFSPKRLLMPMQRPQRSALKFITVTSIHNVGRMADTYCFKEEKRGMGLFNGIITGQCCEVVEYTNPDEVAVCTLASLALPKCLAGNHFEHSRLEKIARLAVRNLNSVVDINTYPVPEAELSNKRHRPIGIGIQGLHDVFQRLGMPYDSPAAATLNAEIFETIYYASLSESMRLAKATTHYSTFKGSPASKGILQFDMWGVTPSTRYDWGKLKTQIKKWGLRNSLLVAPMPTASTAQILGNTESFEPRTSNLYTRRVLAGEYMVVNPHLQDKLVELGLWNENNRRNLIANRGSVQGMNIPKKVKEVFKTVWELSQKALINLSVGRSPYICQSQSLNLYLESPTRAKLSSMGFYAWSKGLKTGQYYLRSQPKARPIQFTVVKKIDTSSIMECEEDVCIMCSS